MTNAERIQANNAELQECLNLAKNIISGGSGGVELNIAYGDEPPEDTSKLWVKTDMVDGVRLLSSDVVGLHTLNTKTPKVVYGAAAATIGTDVYLFGGMYVDNSSARYDKKIYKFDTKTESIKTLTATLPTNLYDTSANSVGTKIYLFGGRSSSSSIRGVVDMFDTETEMLSTGISTLPEGLGSTSSAVVGEKIYLFGGSTASGYTKYIRSFDTKTGVISTMGETLPTAMCAMGISVVGTKIYLFGGRSSSDKYDTILEFDTETEKLYTLSRKLAEQLNSIIALAYGKKIYLFGGQGNDNALRNTIYKFDTETESRKRLGFLLPRTDYDVASTIVGAKMYLFGGKISGYSDVYSDTITSFNESFPLTKNYIAILTGDSVDTIELLSGVTTGIGGVYKGNDDNIAEEVEAYIYKNSEWVLI